MIKALLDGGELRLDGLICPGHVSAVIGAAPYTFIPREFGIACVIAGFEPVDILQAIDMLLAQVYAARPAVEVAYTRGVPHSGNPHALRVMEEVFEPAAVAWRGVGEVAGSGLKLRPKYAAFDAEKLFDMPPVPARKPDRLHLR